MNYLDTVPEDIKTYIFKKYFDGYVIKEIEKIKPEKRWINPSERLCDLCDDVGFYVLYIKKREEYIKNIMKNFSFNVNYVLGPNKNKFNIDDLIKNNIITKKYSKRTNTGKVACHLGHMSILKRFLKSSKEYAIIFEDDINIDNYLETENNIRKILNNLPEDFDIIYLDYCWSNCKKQNDYDEYFKNSNHTLCRHFYLVSRDGASKILKETMPMYDNGDLMYLDLVDNNKLVSYDVKPEIFKVKQNREQLGSELSNDDTHPKCKTFNDEINSVIFGFFGSVFKGSS